MSSMMMASQTKSTTPDRPVSMRAAAATTTKTTTTTSSDKTVASTSDPTNYDDDIQDHPKTRSIIGLIGERTQFTETGHDAGTSSIRVEFAINYSSEQDLMKIDDTLTSQGIKVDSINTAEKTFLIGLKLGAGSHGTTNFNDIGSLQRFIEEQTGLTTVVKGIGQLSTAVAEIGPPPISKQQPGWRRQVMGVVRLSQLEGNSCYVDGLLDGLKEDERYSLTVHEFGDLTGDYYENIGGTHVEIESDRLLKSNSLSIHKILPNCHVPSMIGRSIALSLQSSSEPPVIGSGIVARASTINSNKKQICTCSGKTLWEERRDKESEKEKQ